MKSRREFLRKSLWLTGGAAFTSPFWASLLGVKRYRRGGGVRLERRWDALNPAPPEAVDLAALRLPVAGPAAAADFAAAAEMTRTIIEALGGMGRFVSPGDTVYVKPNIGWARRPEYAATTNPDVVGEIVRLAKAAGARDVQVGDRSCEEPRKCYEESRIGPAVEAAGGRMVFPREYVRVRSPLDPAREWLVDANYLAADKVISAAIAKHHALTGATLAMKNLFGAVGGERSRLHQRVHESIAELALLLRPTLCLVDGLRALASNGPQGGSLSYVEHPLAIVAGVDPVAVDAFALRHMFGGRYGGSAALPRFVARAEEYGVGFADWTRAKSRCEGFGG
ncbi:MAG: DUF362 domain-containing protein [Planctomycetes bacterium]|nr:DUF362 domain-containing protein [Planctomycetota bacterium]